MKTNALRMLLLWTWALAPGRAPADVIAKPAPIAPPTAEWIARVKELAPAAPTAAPKRKREVLLFDLFTGFDHKVIPHADEAVKAIGEKSGAFSVVQSADIEMFSPENIGRFDGIILNNNCSDGARRDLILDALDGKIKDARHAALGDRYKALPPEARKEKAAALEKSLVDHIAAGHGLILIHGAIVMQNNSERFGEMVGGSFDYHPKAQEFSVFPVDPKHPLLAAFHGEPFRHTDEPYMFKNAYGKKNFRPLLLMKSADIQGMRAAKPGDKPVDETLYVSWIKKSGGGRVFFVSPSHFPESYLSKAMLQFYLDGIQYALGDIDCDDTPLGR